MSSGPHQRVANPPEKPLMIFDGSCHFCRHWIERWRENTGGRVEYASSQEVASRFPEIPPDAFDIAVQFIETDGRVVSGAEAVFRSLGYTRCSKWLAWCYDRVPGFAAVTESAYHAIAQRRQLASAGTRLLWGTDVRRPSYVTTRSVFLRCLGAIYLIAFVSLWTQVDGLIGTDGISPVADYLAAARDHYGANARWLLPTLCWLNASNAFLHLLCSAGVVASLLLVGGVVPAVCLLVLFVSYLSLTIAGQSFLSFQWDILLLEAGFLAIFFAPWTWRIKRSTHVCRTGLFLLKLLLFKLMFMSGVVKLTSGDESWWNLTALRYHYETQPLPTVLGWWADHAPEWVGRVSTGFVLVVELLVPLLLWAPRRLRLAACALLIGLQVLIALTGNYAFFNLLTIVLALLLIDDAIWRSFGRRVFRLNRMTVAADGSTADARRSAPQRLPAIAVLIVTLPVNLMLIYSSFRPDADWPRVLAALQEKLEPLRIVNGYGLFRVMTKTRPEVEIEGSADGVEWKEYRFRWKADQVDRRPRWVAPHQPRLDWQMWFAALGTARRNSWFLQLNERLLLGSPAVLALLQTNPFPDAPPKYVRATMYDYKFTSVPEHRATGAWWKRERTGEYLPPVSLSAE